MKYYADKERGPKYIAGKRQATKQNANAIPLVYVFIRLNMHRKCLKERPSTGDHTSSERAQGQEAPEARFPRQGTVSTSGPSVTTKPPATTEERAPVRRPPGSGRAALRVQVSTAVLGASPRAFPAAPGSPRLLIARCQASPSRLASLHEPHTLHFRLLRPSSQSASPGGPARYGHEARTLYPAKHLTSNNPGTKFAPYGNWFPSPTTVL